jgi:hypothetical protein
MTIPFSRRCTREYWWRATTHSRTCYVVRTGAYAHSAVSCILGPACDLSVKWWCAHSHLINSLWRIREFWLTAITRSARVIALWPRRATEQVSHNTCTTHSIQLYLVTFVACNGYTWCVSHMYLHTIHRCTWCVSHMYLHAIHRYTWCVSHMNLHTWCVSRMYLRTIRWHTWCASYVPTHLMCVPYVYLHTINWYTHDVHPICTYVQSIDTHLMCIHMYLHTVSAWCGSNICTYIQTMHPLDVGAIYVLIYKQCVHLMWVSYVLMYKQYTHLLCM